MSRYNRHIILSEIGPAGQDKISKAKVLVVGAGGLGCPVLQYLAAAGIGTLGIVDFDVVDESNLQRQVLYGLSSLGQNKATAAKMRLSDLNCTIQINNYTYKLTFQNAIELFNQYDIIVDGTDNFETRYLVNDAAVLTGKPLVFGAIYKFQGQVSVFNLNNGPTYRCAFPNKPEKDTVPNCSEVGVLGVLPGIIGSLQANEVLKIVLGIGDVLAGKLLYYDALSNQTTTLKVKRSDLEIEKVLSGKKDFSQRELDGGCKIDIPEVSVKDILGKPDVEFIDIREHFEQPKLETVEALQIPLSELRQHLDKINPNKEKAIFCQSGIRSKQAVSILRELNIENCFSVREGAAEIDSYIKELQKTGIK